MHSSAKSSKTNVCQAVVVFWWWLMVFVFLRLSSLMYCIWVLPFCLMLCRNLVNFCCIACAYKYTDFTLHHNYTEQFDEAIVGVPTYPSLMSILRLVKHFVLGFVLNTTTDPAVHGQPLYQMTHSCPNQTKAKEHVSQKVWLTSGELLLVKQRQVHVIWGNIFPVSVFDSIFFCLSWPSVVSQFYVSTPPSFSLSASETWV